MDHHVAVADEHGPQCTDTAAGRVQGCAELSNMLLVNHKISVHIFHNFKINLLSGKIMRKKRFLRDTHWVEIYNLCYFFKNRDI